MKTLRQWLRLDAAETPAADHAEGLRDLIDALDRLEPNLARFLAAFAYLLGRVAHADSRVSAEETQVMERLVMERGGLPNEQAMIVVQLAKTSNLLFGGTANFLVAREFERIATREEKLALLKCLFAVSSADESIATIEDNEIRRISRELRIEHADFIAIRAAYAQHLSVLERDEREPGESGSGG